MESLAEINLLSVFLRPDDSTTNVVIHNTSVNFLPLVIRQHVRIMHLNQPKFYLDDYLDSSKNSEQALNLTRCFESHN